MTAVPPDPAITDDAGTKPPTVLGLSARPLDFGYLRVKGGGEAGARDLFQGLVAQLVTNIRPGAREVEGSGGDWGIDVFVGELTTDGEVGVWQAKYFIDGLKPAQRRQIKSSFDAAAKKAEEHGYRLGAWTLCVPCLLTPAEWTWWQRFRREREKASGVPIFLMEATALYDRRHLERVLGAYVAHYVDERPHRGLGLAVPAGIRPAQFRGRPQPWSNEGTCSAA